MAIFMKIALYGYNFDEITLPTSKFATISLIVVIDGIDCNTNSPRHCLEAESSFQMSLLALNVVCSR